MGDSSIYDDAGSATASPYSQRVSADAGPKKGQEKAGVNPGGGDQSQETKAGKLASKEGANLPKASRVEQLGQGLQVVTIPRPGGVGSAVGTGSFFILPASRSVATFQRPIGTEQVDVASKKNLTTPAPYPVKKKAMSILGEEPHSGLPLGQCAIARVATCNASRVLKTGVQVSTGRFGITDE